LLQALGLLCELAGRTENHFGGMFPPGPTPASRRNVLHDPLRALRGLLHAAGISLVERTLLLHRGGDRCGDLVDLPDVAPISRIAPAVSPVASPIAWI